VNKVFDVLVFKEFNPFTMRDNITGATIEIWVGCYGHKKEFQLFWNR
jgi:hypothetical protein